MKRECGGISFGESASSQEEIEDMRLVLIEWVDSYGCGSQWQALEDCQAKPLICRSVGWLFHDADDCKVVVPHISDSNNGHVSAQGCGDMTIPTLSILHITELSIPA